MNSQNLESRIITAIEKILDSQGIQYMRNRSRVTAVEQFSFKIKTNTNNAFAIVFTKPGPETPVLVHFKFPKGDHPGKWSKKWKDNSPARCFKNRFYTPFGRGMYIEDDFYSPRSDWYAIEISVEEAANLQDKIKPYLMAAFYFASSLEPKQLSKKTKYIKCFQYIIETGEVL